MSKNGMIMPINFQTLVYKIYNCFDPSPYQPHVNPM